MSYFDRTFRNLVIAAFAVLVLVGLATTGLALRYRLSEPPANPAPSADTGVSSHAGEEPTWLGCDEDLLEDIHFYLALSFVALIVLHAMLHGKWLWAACKGPTAQWQSGRAALIAAFMALVLVLLLLPVLIPAH